jgi:hypothetical protein
VRKPETTSAFTGTVHPDAVISPAAAHRAVVLLPAARAAPPVSTLTISVASGSCFAYASGYALT